MSSNHTSSHRVPYRTLLGANKPLDKTFSLAITIPSLAKIPTQVPALLIASIAYSTWCSLPSGENVVVEESYLLAILYFVYRWCLFWFWSHFCMRFRWWWWWRWLIQCLLLLLSWLSLISYLACLIAVICDATCNMQHAHLARWWFFCLCFGGFRSSSLEKRKLQKNKQRERKKEREWLLPATYE